MTHTIALSLSNRDTVLCAVPHLLGFTPERSAVLIWLSNRRILLTQRLDLPHPSVDLDTWVQVAWNHAAAPVADELVVVMVGDEADVAAPTRALLDRAAEADLPVKDALRLVGDRWWSLLCDDPDCCPPEGRVLDPGVRLEVAAEFAGAGSAPLGSRAELAAAVDEDPTLVAEVTAVGRRPVRGRQREQWRDRVLGDLLEYLLGDTGAGDSGALPDASARATMLEGLADVRVRDTLLWEACRWDGDQVALAIDRVAFLVRSAPVGLVAPVATCAAVCAWLAGDGARALVALERATADDPAYSLAGLVLASIRGGLPPSLWRAAMGDLTRAECRWGLMRPGSLTA